MLAELKKSSGNTRASSHLRPRPTPGPGREPLLLAEAGQSRPGRRQSRLPRALTKTAAGEEVTAAAQAAHHAQRRRRAFRGGERRRPGPREDGRRRQPLDWRPARRSAGADRRCRIALDRPAARLRRRHGAGGPQSRQRDPDARVRDAAVRALAEWPDASAWEPWPASIASGAPKPLRGLALRGLVRLAGEENAHPDAKLIERYRQLLADARGDADYRLILGALGGAAEPDALQLALPLLANAGVRPEAEVAVKKIAESIKAQHPQAAQEALQKTPVESVTPSHRNCHVPRNLPTARP